MARKSSSAISDDELEGVVSEPAKRASNFDESPLDARMLDLDDEAESPFLRGQRRVPVRRGPLPIPESTAGKIKLVLVSAGVAAGIAIVWIALYRYGTGSWRFRLDSSDNIMIAGANHVSRSQILDVMASDLERNIFFVPLQQRQEQLERIPWIKSASVMRLLPNRLKIDLGERTPVAFVDIDSHIHLIDAAGVVMDLSTAQMRGYSFPIIVGMTDADPLSTRAARMKIYTQFMKELDAGGANYSRDISDIDVSDPDDVRVTIIDPQGAVLVHFGSSNFLQRFQTYVAHVQQWRSQFPGLQSIDLRFDHQVIVNPDLASSQVHVSSAEVATTVQKSSADDKAANAPPVKKHRKHK